MSEQIPEVDPLDPTTNWQFHPGTLDHWRRMLSLPLVERFPWVPAELEAVHSRERRLAEGQARGNQVRLSEAWRVVSPSDAGETARLAARDLVDFAKSSLGWEWQIVPQGPGQQSITLRHGTAGEGYRIAVGEEAVELLGDGSAGLLYAVHRLEEMLKLADGPCLPIGRRDYKPILYTRVYRSPMAPFCHNELSDQEDYYPDAYLDRLAHHGFNGIWVGHQQIAGLVESPVLPGPDPHRERRLAKLCGLVERAARYGIKVYLHFTEPAAYPKGHPFWEVYPQLRGASSRKQDTWALCTSQPETLAHLEQSFRALFSQAPGLGGVQLITASELHHHCYSHVDVRDSLGEELRSGETDCPRCARRRPQEVVAEVVRAIRDGVRAVSPNAKVIAWNWSWCFYEEDPQRGILELLPKDVAVMGDFERGEPICRGGVPHTYEEYSLSIVGPGPRYRLLAEACRDLGLEYFARVQIPTTHEAATLPYWPVMDNLAAKYGRLTASGAAGVVACWNFGNFLGLSTRLANRLSWRPAPSREQALEELAISEFGEAAAPCVRQAWSAFSRASGHYPASGLMLATSPLNRGPSYPLFIEPTGKQMPQSWLLGEPLGDRIADYLQPYPLEPFLASLSEMLTGWEAGIAHLARALAVADAGRRDQVEDQLRIARAFACQARSLFNFTKFIALRDRVKQLPDDEQSGLLAKMKDLANKELTNAREALPLYQADPKLGFHGEAYGYMCNPDLILQKCRQMESLLAEDPPAMQADLIADKRPR